MTKVTFKATSCNCLCFRLETQSTTRSDFVLLQS